MSHHPPTSDNKATISMVVLVKCLLRSKWNLKCPQMKKMFLSKPLFSWSVFLKEWKSIRCTRKASRFWGVLRVNLVLCHWPVIRELVKVTCSMLCLEINLSWLRGTVLRRVIRLEAVLRVSGSGVHLSSLRIVTCISFFWTRRALVTLRNLATMMPKYSHWLCYYRLHSFIIPCKQLMIKQSRHYLWLQNFHLLSKLNHSQLLVTQPWMKSNHQEIAWDLPSKEGHPWKSKKPKACKSVRLHQNSYGYWEILHLN